VPPAAVQFPGAKKGHEAVQREAGGGGFGSVYKGRITPLDGAHGQACRGGAADERGGEGAQP